tara:strand:+ start:1928 stop:2077 length:150 start_codon:yes stop_codon:yes gene_type:complete
MQLEIKKTRQKNGVIIYTLLRNYYPVVQSTNIKHILEDKKKQELNNTKK